jgi:hypothetical protein
MIRTARGQSKRGGVSRVRSTDPNPRRRQATSLFSRADQTSVIKIRSRRAAKRHWSRAASGKSRSGEANRFSI